ncbi:MAG: hypothetical protein ACOY3D_07540, partial [Candidatus Omnitrophota bacterium]
MKHDLFFYRRLFEIIPAFLSWWIIILLVILSIMHPVAGAVALIVYEIYWMVRTFYLTALLGLAHYRLNQERERNWLADCHKEKEGCVDRITDIYHAVIFTVYKESVEILASSLNALLATNYPKDKMLVVMAFEEREPLAGEKAGFLEKEYGDKFFYYLSTFHPDGLPGEARLKGANATWAGRRLKEFIDRRRLPYETITVSCFDADTCVDKEYFSCLTFHFLT